MRRPTVESGFLEMVESSSVNRLYRSNMTRRLATWLAVASLAGAAESPVKFDNEVVRILSVVDTPGRKSAMHKHDVNRVMIYLDSGAIDLKYEDGRVEHQRWKPGQVAWSPAGGMHTSENVGKAGPLRIVEIELKQPGPAALAARNKSLDPVALDPKNNRLLLENEQVRVFRSVLAPGKSEKMHEHTGRGRVVVLLTDIQASVVTPGAGTPSPFNGKAGEVRWSAGAVTHQGTNNGSKPFDMILVEVK